ncbi:MAG: exodeoxyribonuclease V subunit beta, partial [Betaproteobacteria bacterium]|nr:exodeoxyribonuclease V subunit beta [Betaproteobacteria bacterium]
ATPTFQAQKLDALRMPLRGRQVIEASAGTGKTWTLAALYLRLVLGHQRDAGLLPPQILVMTFTDAATAELRDRIRARLSQAAVFFDASAQDKPLPLGFKADPFLIDLRDSYDKDTWPGCAIQLNCAAEWMDDAAIYTIHGWSRRMLSQHALDSRNLFEQTHLENAEDLQRELVQDYWRAWFYPLSAQSLETVSPFIGNAPDVLLNKVRTIWSATERQPGNTETPALNPHQIIEVHTVWAQTLASKADMCRKHWSDALYATLQEVGGKKKLKNVRSDHYAKWLQALKDWAEDQATIKSDVIARFTTEALTDKNWPEAKDFAFFSAVDDYVAYQKTEPSTEHQLVLHAAHTVGEKYKIAKAQRAAFDFSDLLQNLHAAVMAEDGRLASSIRHQYPVALVDEFQDTDPWQYQTLDKIYADGACTARNALIMIGDPKQAIYSFRGADLGTYLTARQDAITSNPQAIHTLSSNRRSTARLVHALNHVFSQIDEPFACAQGRIDYLSVSAESDVEGLVNPDGTPHPALSVWHMPCDGKPTKADTYLQAASHAFADRMAELLNRGVATPGEMAVLVRGQHQADAIRHALRARQIPSVYLSDRSNVYATTEALDIWRLLRAVATPRQTEWVRAAIGSTVWALTLDEVLGLTQDELQWEAQLDNFHQWRQIWQQQGVLAMMHQWLHSQGIASRLLADENGERRISNVLHLGELLQHAAQSLQGEHTLVRFLGAQIHKPTQSADAQKMRLETDAQCVQVITYHKSKGLQYPLVFVPFMGSFKTEKSSKTSFAEDEEANDETLEPSSVDEDMRIIYVALTRAQRALWIGVAETFRDISGDIKKDTFKQSALSKLLKRKVRGDLNQQLNTLWGSCQDICIQALPEPRYISYLKPSLNAVPQDALTPKLQHHSPWWTASFSALTRGLLTESKRDEDVATAIIDADTEQLALVDKKPDQVSRWQNFPAGARYGTLMHDLLDWLSQNQWPLANPQAPAWSQQAWAELLERKSNWLQLKEFERNDLGAWLQEVIQTPLPLNTHHLGFETTPLVLGQLTPEHMWSEMEFNLEAHQVPAKLLDQHIQSHLFVGEARPALQPRLMQGMLTGSLDLVLQHDHRYWVVDYKSNKLNDYAPTTLQDAVLHKRYEVQYVLYTLALHRLLKIRLPDYDYEQHMGGAVYLFMRGINQTGAGVHFQRPPQALIETLDNLFAGIAV